MTMGGAEVGLAVVAKVAVVKIAHVLAIAFHITWHAIVTMLGVKLALGTIGGALFLWTLNKALDEAYAMARAQDRQAPTFMELDWLIRRARDEAIAEARRRRLGLADMTALLKEYKYQRQQLLQAF